MSQTTGSHGVSTFTSPVNGDALDATIVTGNDNALRSAYVAHDADTGIHVQSSLLSARPNAGTSGRKWMTTDSGSVRLWFDTGSIWEEIGYVPATGSASFTGDLSVAGNVTLGDASTDTIATNAQFSTDIVPSSNGSNDLGTTTKNWRNAYVTGVTASGTVASSNVSASTNITTPKMVIPSGGMNIRNSSDSSNLVAITNSGVTINNPTLTGTITGINTFPTYIYSVLSSSTSITTQQTVVSITLTPGTWRLEGTVYASAQLSSFTSCTSFGLSGLFIAGGSSIGSSVSAVTPASQTAYVSATLRPSCVVTVTTNTTVDLSAAWTASGTNVVISSATCSGASDGHLTHVYAVRIA